VKGEFVNRLKSVIDEVKRSPVPIILFIDEAHTLIGAGGAAGQNDAANLLKPALARGELRTIAATTLADLLYGGDRNMVIVNMSEYKESHKVSRLVGTSKGYVGYGEGGVLTNAVKNRPYSVVLLDEVEKAHESVQEIFYQVFDKGVLQNDDGEDVNFKNTIILLTSNVGTDRIMKACADPDTAPGSEGLAAMMKADLLKAFKPALLGCPTVLIGG
jgi:type VI secretion system protein VasG